MSMRFLLLLALCALPLVAQAAAARPNFVVFIADDLSTFDTQPYGAQDIRTPYLARLAAEGMTFTHCFVASPSCGPSRTALLTGLWPARSGAEANHMPKRKDVASLPPALRTLGYEVAAFGKVAHVRHAPLHGFDVAKNESSAAVVREFLTKRDASRPLCLFLGTRHPHVPWSENDGYDPAALCLPPGHVDTPETRAMRARYATDVTNADEWVAELDSLTRELVKGDTLRLFTADHGSQWPFAKWNLYDAGIRVPFLAVWPGRLTAGSRSDAMICWPDLLPTFMELAGGKVPEGLDGRSFADVLRGRASTHRDRIFTTHSGDGNMNVYPIRSVRTREWKYIRNLQPGFQHHSHISRAGIPDGLGYWQSWMKAAATDPAAAAIVRRHIERPAEELYDLAADPDEQRNLAADPAHAPRIAALRAELDAWMKAQGDAQTVFGNPLPLGRPAPPLAPGENRTPPTGGQSP